MEDLVMNQSIKVLGITYNSALNSGSNHITRKEKNIKKVVYVCFDFKGNLKKDIMLANRYCKFAASKGVIALSPYMLCAEFANSKSPNKPKTTPVIPLDIIPTCDELWCFGINISNSMIEQLEKAHKFSKPIKYFTSKCTEII